MYHPFSVCIDLWILNNITADKEFHKQSEPIRDVAPGDLGQLFTMFQFKTF